MTKKQVSTALEQIYELLELDGNQRAEYIRIEYGYDYLNNPEGSTYFIEGVIQRKIKQLQKEI